MASGMTVTSWCKANGILEQTYYKNLKKLCKLELEKLPPALIPVPEEKTVALKRLEVQTLVANTQAAVIIRLPNAMVEISEGTSQQTIHAVLLALQSVC